MGSWADISRLKTYSKTNIFLIYTHLPSLFQYCNQIHYKQPQTCWVHLLSNFPWYIFQHIQIFNSFQFHQVNSMNFLLLLFFTSSFFNTLLFDFQFMSTKPNWSYFWKNNSLKLAPHYISLLLPCTQVKGKFDFLLKKNDVRKDIGF